MAVSFLTDIPANFGFSLIYWEVILSSPQQKEKAPAQSSIYIPQGNPHLLGMIEHPFQNVGNLPPTVLSSEASAMSKTARILPNILLHTYALFRTHSIKVSVGLSAFPCPTHPGIYSGSAFLQCCSPCSTITWTETNTSECQSLVATGKTTCHTQPAAHPPIFKKEPITLSVKTGLLSLKIWKYVPGMLRLLAEVRKQIPST